ncbi:hypothetical protein V6N13_115732 [Hibiscus sabdariffa]|uniref:Uncharacterized protein n=1 Tax=Hibiscus sabdariffa TaxID=183260 RepID=A0ABR2CT42_9ROSI
MGFDLGRKECVGSLESNLPVDDKAKVIEGFRLSASKGYEVVESSVNRKDSLIAFEDGVGESGLFPVPAVHQPWAKETSVMENIVGFKPFGTEPEVLISCYLFLELYAGWYVAIWLRGVEFWLSISKDNSRTRLVVGKGLVAEEFVQFSPLRFVISDRC